MHSPMQSLWCIVPQRLTQWMRERYNPMASRNRPLLPLKPTIMPPSMGNVKGVPSSAPNGPNDRLLLLNASDRITGDPPCTTGATWPLTVIRYSSGYSNLTWIERVPPFPPCLSPRIDFPFLSYSALIESMHRPYVRVIERTPLQRPSSHEAPPWPPHGPTFIRLDDPVSCIKKITQKLWYCQYTRKAGRLRPDKRSQQLFLSSNVNQCNKCKDSLRKDILTCPRNSLRHNILLVRVKEFHDVSSTYIYILTIRALQECDATRRKNNSKIYAEYV